MKIEEAIEFLEQYTNNEVYTEKCVSAHATAITALRSMSEAKEPLTVERLREVPHGKIKDSTLQNIANRANEIAPPPAHIDRSEWISVKERLPNFGIPVLICWDGYTDIAEYRCGMVCPKWRTQHYGTVDLASATHWMPLPEPPEEG